MNLNVQTIFWMDAFLYLMLHVAIWYGLARFRSKLVVMWSASGICSAFSLCLLGSKGMLPLDVVVVAGQCLMVMGNWGRQWVLRALNGPADPVWVRTSVLVNVGFLLLSFGLHFSGSPESTLMLLFYAYFSINCLEYFFSGKNIARTHDIKGARSVMWAGLILSGTLGIKALAMVLGVGAVDLYANSWDHVMVFVGQFTAMVMLCVGFMQIFVDQNNRVQMVVQQELAREQERARLAIRHSEDLEVLLLERDEIIRQLTLSNKSAGMGALVASFAHELNQPLQAILLHAELLQGKLKNSTGELSEHDLVLLNTVADCIVSDTHRSADIIGKLRSLFRMSKGENKPVNFNRLVTDVVDLVRARMEAARIQLTMALDAELVLNADATQLQQVVLNLINNAIDALVEKGSGTALLTIRGRLSDGHVILHVEDNGKGIAAERQEDVFSLFKTSKSEGMGVGLWLSRAIVESHRGQLDFKSEPGSGTVFTLRLPCQVDSLLR